MPVLSWAPRWPLAAASRREITEAALTSLSARATVMPSPNPPPSPDPLFSLGPASFLAHPPPTRPRCKLSQICQMMASSVRSLSRYPAKLVPVFFFFFSTHPHPVLLSSLLETCTTRKNLYPPPHIPLPSSPIVDCFTFCYPSAFSLSASSWFVLLPATSKENQGSQSHRHGI